MNKADIGTASLNKHIGEQIAYIGFLDIPAVHPGLGFAHCEQDFKVHGTVRRQFFCDSLIWSIPG